MAERTESRKHLDTLRKKKRRIISQLRKDIELHLDGKLDPLPMTKAMMKEAENSRSIIVRLINQKPNDDLRRVLKTELKVQDEYILELEKAKKRIYNAKRYIR
jgi:hypothetical protein